MKTSINPFVLTTSELICVPCVDESWLYALQKPACLGHANSTGIACKWRSNSIQIALEAVRSNPVSKRFKHVTRTVQTCDKNGSNMRQNGSKNDCLPYWFVSHNIITLWHLPQSDGLDRVAATPVRSLSPLAGTGSFDRAQNSTRAIHECTYPCSMGVPPMHTGETPVLHPVVNCSNNSVPRAVYMKGCRAQSVTGAGPC